MYTGILAALFFTLSAPFFGLFLYPNKNGVSAGEAEAPFLIREEKSEENFFIRVGQVNPA